MLNELLRVKRLREQDAAAAVQAAQARLDEARAAVRRAEDALARHHDFRLVEEKRLFDEIKGEPVSVARIDEMKLAISILREKEMTLHGDIETARQAVAPLEAALSEAEVGHRVAMAAVRKFEELVELETNDAIRASVRREEAEAEEVTEAMFGGNRSGAI